jgi:hypothetical protein
MGVRVDYTLEQADAMYALLARAWSKHWDGCEQCIDRDWYGFYTTGEPIERCPEGQQILRTKAKWQRRIARLEREAKK